MYYENRHSRRRRSRYEGPGFFARLLRFVVVVIIIWAIAAAGWTLILDHGWTDILLLGIDHDSEGTSRSDTIIVASVGPLGQVRLTSILRDTWVDIPGHGQNKINAAYHFGDIELALETVNQAFGLDIENYAVVSLRTFPMLIDTLGGIELTVTEAEKDEVNNNLASTRRVLAKSGVDTSDLTTWGENVHLTGAQALSFARIRSIGNDYERTSRQRRVLEAMLTKARHTYNPITLYTFFKQALEITDTNVFWPHVGALGVFALIRNDVKQLRLPAEGTYESGTYDGVWSIRPNLEANRQILQEFLRY